MLSSQDPAAWLNIGGPGLCGSSAPLAVGFGTDMATGCTWPVLLSDFSDCAKLRARAAALLLSAAEQPELLGKFGNSNQLKPALDWIALENRGPIDVSPIPGPASNVCPDVPTGLHLEILTAM